ncbi:uncharacterized protein LOC144389435 [Gasterosteus aculeatus]
MLKLRGDPSPDSSVGPVPPSNNPGGGHHPGGGHLAVHLSGQRDQKQPIPAPRLAPFPPARDPLAPGNPGALSNPQRGSQAPGQECWRCGQLGHLRRECPLMEVGQVIRVAGVPAPSPGLGATYVKSRLDRPHGTQNRDAPRHDGEVTALQVARTQERSGSGGIGEYVAVGGNRRVQQCLVQPHRPCG